MLQFIPETQEQKYLIIRKERNSDKAWKVRDKSVPDKGIQVKEEDFIYIVQEKIFRVHRSLENDIEKKNSPSGMVWKSVSKLKKKYVHKCVQDVWSHEL